MDAGNLTEPRLLPPLGIVAAQPTVRPPWQGFSFGPARLPGASPATPPVLGLGPDLPNPFRTAERSAAQHSSAEHSTPQHLQNEIGAGPSGLSPEEKTGRPNAEESRGEGSGEGSRGEGSAEGSQGEGSVGGSRGGGGGEQHQGEGFEQGVVPGADLLSEEGTGHTVNGVVSCNCGHMHVDGAVAGDGPVKNGEELPHKDVLRERIDGSGQISASEKGKEPAQPRKRVRFADDD